MTHPARAERDDVEDLSLSEQPTLVLDGQASGASPRHGHLIELGWCWLPHGVAALRAAAAEPIEASLIALPEGSVLPPRVAKLTGISADDLTDASDAEHVWRRVLEVCAGGPRPLCVIHYARFEAPFLRALHGTLGTDTELPFDLVCTHELARRLFPDLPRRGLRALAGYLGVPMPPGKRASAHVSATLRVWRHLLQRAHEDRGVQRPGELQALLQTPAPKAKQKRPFRLPRETRLQLPEEPGIYRMLGHGGQVLYVGKATSLKQRVNSYFRTRKGGAQQTLEMLTQVWHLDVTPTATALEAALLETDEIKAHDPPYNVALKHAEREVRYVVPPWQVVDTPRRGCRGPFVGEGPWATLATISDCLRAPGNDPSLLRELAPLLDDTDSTLISEAVELFRERLAGAPLSPSHVVRLGCAWRDERAAQALADADASESEEESDDTEDADAPFEWTAARLEGHFEGMVRHASRLILRGRWFRLLANATVSWEPTGAGERRWLQLQDGVVIARGRGEAPPPSPAEVALARMDLPTYDRLRVLTTELRRVLTEDRRPMVRLRSARLGDDVLRRLMRHV